MFNKKKTIETQLKTIAQLAQRITKLEEKIDKKNAQLEKAKGYIEENADLVVKGRLASLEEIKVEVKKEILKKAKPSKSQLVDCANKEKNND